MDDENVREEFQPCKHFLVDSKVDNGRHRVFTYAKEILDAHTLSQRLDKMFEKVKFAAKLIVAFGFVPKNVEDRTFRYCYAYENNTLMGRSELVANKEVLIKIKNVLSNTDVKEACTKERANTK